MNETYLKKIGPQLFRAEDMDHIKMGDVIKCTYTRPRNYQFHKKYMALLNLAFDAWEPHIQYKGEEVEKNFDRFRKDIAILAGYYDLVPTMKGEAKAEAKSISFGKMTEEEFTGLYDKTIDVLLKRVLTNYTRDDVDRVVQDVLGFV